MYATIRLNPRGPQGHRKHMPRGQVVQFLPVNLATGFRMNKDNVDLDFGGSDGRTRLAFVRFTNMDPVIRRAVLRGDRRSLHDGRRFRLDLAAFRTSLSAAPKRAWLGRMFDAQTVATVEDIMSNSVGFPLTYDFWIDRRTDDYATEQTIRDWDPVTGTVPPLPPGWIDGDPIPGGG